MKPIVSKEEMQFADSTTISYYGMNELVLMERAAFSVIEVLLCNRELKEKSDTTVLVVCGSGNNGGDGFAIARLLLLQGFKVEVLFVGNTDHMSQSCKKQQEIYLNYAKQYESKTPVITKLTYHNYDWVIDAVFGIGLNKPLSTDYIKLFEQLNRMKAKKFAVDIPSGIEANTGHMLGTAFFADYTVTFAYMKRGLLLSDGHQFSGKIIVADIGITLDGLPDKPAGYFFVNKDFSYLPSRNPNGNKGSFGKVGVFAGSADVGGAAILCTKAIYHMGCGYVRLLTHQNNRDSVLTMIPEAVVKCYEEHQDIEPIWNDIFNASSVCVLGPGIDQSDSNKVLITNTIKRDEKPLIFDADALNIIAQSDEILNWLIQTKGCRKHPIIFTPHLMEFSRLCRIDLSQIKENLFENVISFSKKYGVILVCKDAVTITASKDGRYCINRTGNDGMASAGSGDVLAGMIAALAATMEDAMLAASYGVYLHGLLGDLAQKEVGKRYMTASNLIEQMKIFSDI